MSDPSETPLTVEALIRALEGAEAFVTYPGDGGRPSRGYVSLPKLLRALAEIQRQAPPKDSSTAE